MGGIVQKETVVFGGGCFWCTEAVFLRLGGVLSVTPGYAGGTTKRPTYEQVVTGATGHAEVVRIEYDPDVTSFHDLLTVFFATHNGTTPNRQGSDVGTQYRSMILYATEAQRREAEAFIRDMENDGATKMVTEIVPLEAFYPAEEYHRNYFEKHGDAPYCQAVIRPKLGKLEDRFHSLLKENV